MGKLADKKREKIINEIHLIPEERLLEIDLFIKAILGSNKQEKKKIDLSEFAGTLKLPKNFDAVKWQRKLRDEWPD